MHAICEFNVLTQPFNFQSICSITQIMSSSREGVVVRIMICMKVLLHYVDIVEIITESNMKRKNIMFVICYCTAYVLLILSDYLFIYLYIINKYATHGDPFQASYCHYIKSMCLYLSKEIYLWQRMFSSAG